MADKELVIKMSEEIFNRILERNRIHTFDNEAVCDAIKNGTPLPKGHGQLFDERDIVNGNYEIIGNKIYELEPIIEADKESEDKE